MTNGKCSKNSIKLRTRLVSKHHSDSCLIITSFYGDLIFVILLFLQVFAVMFFEQLILRDFDSANCPLASNSTEGNSKASKRWCCRGDVKVPRGELQFSCLKVKSTYQRNIPVVPHKAVAEVSRIGHYRRDWLLWVTDGRAKTLMDWTVQVSRWLIDELTNWLID